MRPAAHPAGGTVTGVAEGRARQILETLRAPGCAAAIWQRQPDPLLGAWLDSLPADRLPALRQSLPADRVAAAVDQACAAAGIAAGPGRRRFCADVADLAAGFAGLMGTPHLQLRLDPVRGDACRRFHVDHVPARLLCTYRGRGTEYGAAGPDGQPQSVQRMAAGWVGVFRGRLWPGAAPCGLLHRSPPIEGSGETRLLLVLDVAVAAEAP
ncbi:MAG: DUF1826 domain-containing protein [Pseudodonghicola sp.]